MIDIINYGSGNIRSVKNALKAIDCEHRVIENYSNLNHKNVCLIPGVGSYYQASRQLKTKGFYSLAKLDKSERPPILGICLGMQLLLERSDEDGKSDGLGIIKGDVIRIRGSIADTNNTLLKTQVGWSSFQINEECTKRPDFLDEFSGNDFYHVHSYMCHIHNEGEILTTYSGIRNLIPTSLYSRQERVLGFQFHPEKSGNKGLLLLKKSLNHMLEI